MFDPLGKTVNMEIMLVRDIGIPSGKVIRDLTTDRRLISKLRRVVPFLGRTRLYLIQLDDDLDLTLPPSRLPFAKEPETRITRFVLLEVRNPDRLEDEFHGRTVGEFTAPVLIGISSVDDLLKPANSVKKDTWPIGPVRVRVVE